MAEKLKDSREDVEKEIHDLKDEEPKPLKDSPKEKKLDVRRTMVASWPHRSICEVLREIYWATEDEEIRKKAVDATVLAKRIMNKLIEYHGEAKWHAGHTDYMGYVRISQEDQDRILKEREAKQAKEDLKKAAWRRQMQHDKNEQKKRLRKRIAARDARRAGVEVELDLSLEPEEYKA
ncbi:hypothetical protein LCGC14_2147380 [marine sediment metagenome]|uniref:Uncharacterized protein n=1 Tax=marine sediment metagenome TaxID=412755 RepID=A0A0F9DWG7_9ZZZZ